MLKYAVCEINGKQYQVAPGRPVDVASLGDKKQVEADVLLLKEDDNLQIGKPYLKDKLKFEVVKSFKGDKIRVFKYHSKANYRRVRGFRPHLSTVLLPVKN